MFSVIARRSAARAAPRAARRFATGVQQEQANAFIAERQAIEAHAGGALGRHSEDQTSV
jgi:hypothetical protein